MFNGGAAAKGALPQSAAGAADQYGTDGLTSRLGALVRQNSSFWILLLLLVGVALGGGSSREDVQWLVVLRPFAVLCCLAGLLLLDRAAIVRFRGTLIFAGAILALIVAHLIPLPPEIWTALPGRQLAADAATAAGMAQPWRPIALVPWRAWNSFYAALVPLAALLLAIGCTPRQRTHLLLAVLLVGGVSATIGFFQALAPGRGIMQIYQHASVGMPIGLLANRNHQAALLCCMLPLLAAFASEPVGRSGVRRWLALAAGLGILPVILATGSRAGLVLLPIALVSVPLIYRAPPRRARQAVPGAGRGRIAAFIGIVAVVALVGFLVSRGYSLERLMATNTGEEQRVASWGPIFEMTKTYFPVGSGIGSFVDAYEVGEPEGLLGTTYLNHAHNDPLELLLEAGLPGMLLLFAAIVGWGWRMVVMIRHPWRETHGVTIARAGAAAIFVLGLASIVDYPLRVPLIACLFAIASVWLAAPEPARRD